MAEGRLPVIRGDTGGLAITPYIPVTFGVGLRALRLDEPRMLVRSVVHDHVHDDADFSLLSLGEQPVKIRHGAVLGIDRLIVGDVVSEIDLGRRIDGREPDCVYAQALEVIKPLGYSVE